ncbi:MAG: response regulator [Verrucomicrobiia bacterium]
MVSLRESIKPVETNISSNRPKILIADDEPDMLRFIKSQLQSRFQIVEATNGQQAIDKAQQFLPDLIVLDMMMPVKDGVQVCQELREKISTRHLPIILVTARADEETKLAALSAGATDFLTKPFSLTELLVRCENLINAFQLQKEIAKKNQELEAALEQIKETESQLVQSAKMASLGRMSAGLIHEINNPLNYANSAMYVLKKELVHLPESSQEKVNETLQDVNDAIQRVRSIVTNLRGFTHPDTESFTWIFVQDVFDAAIHFINPEIHRDNIKVEVQVAKDWEILGNKNQLIHLMINLLQNAIDSMKEKEFKDGEVPTLCIQGGIGSENSISIRDNGMGIKEENREKIFDPFFTTKDVGAGMGLGLSICYRIIHQHQGRVRVESEVGKFCEFIIEFPSQNCKKQSIESNALKV